MENGSIRRGRKDGECDESDSTGSEGDFEWRGETVRNRHGRIRMRGRDWSDGSGASKRGGNEHGTEREKRRGDECHSCLC